MESKVLRCLLVVMHAPHAGRPPHVVDQWWLDAASSVRQYAREGEHMFCCCDANSRFNWEVSDPASAPVGHNATAALGLLETLELAAPSA
eukprot:6004916-Alexandrium_andersonii.AAC.1